MNQYNTIYFIGAGGIGMSALVRYFLSQGLQVAGYDKTATELTRQLEAEGAQLFFDDDASLIPQAFRDTETTLVVRTPAVPQDNRVLQYFMSQPFTLLKRAELLGLITRNSKGLCFAGTHGKTTTSSMAAHLLTESGVGCNAFLGGILKNYNSNLLVAPDSPLTVIEADEYDRSFHTLSPYMAVITATDPDHLDIYGTEEAYLESFSHFTSLIQSGGCLVARKGIKAEIKLQEGVELYTYSANEGGDFHAEHVRIGAGKILFDFHTPTQVVTDIELGIPIAINIENSVAAMAIAWLNGVKEEDLRQGMLTFMGSKRRFDYWIKSDDLVLIDDYAHHPDEVKASLKSLKALYPDRHISVIFQPHLYSRTQDFATEFAQALSLADELILLDIYPARELPIEGVTSRLIFDQVTTLSKELCPKSELLERLQHRHFEVLITLGAGDIDTLLPEIKQTVLNG